MHNNSNKNLNQSTLAIHSTDNTYCFAYRENKNDQYDNFLIKKFENDLCNNLVIDFHEFISNENLKKIKQISVSIGPSNFNASRLVVVLARTISQQINCPLHGFSSFELMAKRIALNNEIYKKNKSFWIYKKLKRKGFIAGKYELTVPNLKNKNFTVKEKVAPKLLEDLKKTELNFVADYKDEKDLTELLNLSNKNLSISNSNSWTEVLPLYPISAIN